MGRPKERHVHGDVLRYHFSQCEDWFQQGRCVHAEGRDGDSFEPRQCQSLRAAPGADGSLELPLIALHVGISGCWRRCRSGFFSPQLSSHQIQRIQQRPPFGIHVKVPCPPPATHCQALQGIVQQLPLSPRSSPPQRSHTPRRSTKCSRKPKGAEAIQLPR